MLKVAEAFSAARLHFRSDLPRIIRFAVVGVLNTALDFATFSLLYYVAHLDLLIANTTAYVVATVNSYALNRFWTFRQQAPGGGELTMAVQFVLFNLVGLGLVNLTLWALSSFLHVLVSKGIAVLVSFTWNYLTSRNVVFSRRRP